MGDSGVPPGGLKPHTEALMQGNLARVLRERFTGEDALLEALNSGHLAGAGLDVFVGEPAPRADVLAHPKLALTPHIGAATSEAQDRIGLELAAQINALA